MKRMILLIVVLVGTVVLLCSCDCKHENYSQATCTTPSICSDCGEIVSNALGHTDGEWIIDKEANCTEDGSKHQVCSVCDATIKTETLTKFGHTDGEWITDKEANCTEGGSKHQVCSVCDATIKTETLTKLGHINGEWITDKEATCNSEGLRHKECIICKCETTEEVILCLPHNYEQSILKESCVNDNAAFVYTCSECEASYSTPFSSISASIIRTDRGVSVSPTTYDVYDYVTYKIVATGGYGSYQYKYEVFKDKSSSTPVTTTSFGNKNTYTIAELNGLYLNKAILKITISDEAGQIVVYEIAVNDDYIDKEVNVLSRNIIHLREHDYGEWIIDENATCTEVGSKHQVCSVCNVENTQSIAAKGHTYEKIVTKKDCFNDAKLTSNCKECGDTTVEIIEPITLSLACTGTGSSSTTNGKKYTRQYTVTVQGGYGTVQLKYELFSCDGVKIPSSSMDFSTTKRTSVTYGEGESINQKVYQITAKDSAGNISIYRFNLADESIIYYTSETHSYDVKYNSQDDQLIYTCCYCQHTYSNSAAIKISVSETYSQFDTADFKEWCQIGVGTSGGYGTLYYKYEVYSSKTSNSPISNLTSDFSATKDWYGVKSAITVEGYVIRVTVKDDYGHMDIKNVLITNSGIEIIN